MELGKFCWNELATTNVAAAKDFYSDLLGWKYTELDMGDTTYYMIETADDRFGGMWQIPNDKKGQIPPHWMGYILVEDVKVTLEKAEKAGATVIMPVTKAGDFGLFGVIQDPTGAHISFWQALKN